MTKFKTIKSKLREIFFNKGWYYEIEDKTPPYYDIYTTTLKFIEDNFYKENKKSCELRHKTNTSQKENGKLRKTTYK